jgi:hypothetical protein
METAEQSKNDPIYNKDYYPVRIKYLLQQNDVKLSNLYNVLSSIYLESRY